MYALGLQHVPTADAGIGLPCLLKPCAACGVPGAHAFALLSSVNAAARADVALPATAQAFVRHDGVVHKVYVYGDAVLTAQRRSLPDPHHGADTANTTRANAHAPPDVVCFDALRSMPSAWHHGGSSGVDRPAPAMPTTSSLNMATVRAMAAWLRENTGMTLFGFDVLIETGIGAHLVVDLNYLPSASGVAGAPAALAAALIRAARGPEQA